MAQRHDSDPDVQLMLRVRDGDATAFEELVREHAAMVTAFARRYVGVRSFAEDLAQDVFLRVWRAAPRYEPRARFESWLLRIAANVCLNRQRWQINHPEASLAGVDGERRDADVPAPDAGPDLDAEVEELRAAVRRAVDGLSPQQRMAVILARFEELSYAEIAEAMEVTVMAVKSLLNRAKANLRGSLERQLTIEPGDPIPGTRTR